MSRIRSFQCNLQADSSRISSVPCKGEQLKQKRNNTLFGSRSSSEVTFQHKMIAALSAMALAASRMGGAPFFLGYKGPWLVDGMPEVTV